MSKKKFLKNIIFVFLLTLITSSVSAQIIRLSGEKNQFIDDLEIVMSDGKNSLSIAQFGTFKDIYNNSFSDENIKAFISLAQKMSGRGHKIGEYYKLLVLINTIQTKGVNQDELNVIIIGLESIINEQTLGNSIAIIEQLTDLFNYNRLYVSKFNKLYITKGAFSFSYLKSKKDYFDSPIINKIESKQKEEDFGLFDDWGVEENQASNEDPWDNPNLEIKPDNYEYLINLPKIGGLIINLESVNLAIVTPVDSMIIEGTSGAVDLIQKIFVGEKGQLDWQNVFIPNAVAYLDKYSFKISNPGFKAENALFTYDPYVKDSIRGILEYIGGKGSKTQLSSYPRFKSYRSEANFNIPEYEVELKGGISLVGNRIFTASVLGNINTLWVNRGKNNAFKAEGKRFEITDSLITSNQASFTTYIQKDSISHPAVKVKYQFKNKQLNLNKVDRGGFRTATYSDTFHEMDIRCDALAWNLNEGSMDFHIVAGKDEVPAVFESFNYYNPARLRNLSDVAGYNPLIFAGNYIYRKRKNEFSLDEIIPIIRKDPNIVRNGVIIATQMGFFDYNPHTDKYALSRKGLHYFESATGRKDYDDLVLSSISKGNNNNATIDRESSALDIQGAQEFKLSDSLGIRFLPKDQSMKLDGSKKFRFTGQIIVKNYRFVGEFEVDYDKFLVNLEKIDSISFIPIDIYKKGGRLEIGGYMKYKGKGVLYLNSPNNKSGRKKLAEYPKLELPEGAEVTFNNPERGKFGYQEKVHFTIPKIIQDSLNEVNMAYPGVFYSAGIFKPISEILTVLPDTSIGFIHAPKGPYELYGQSSIIKFREPLKMTKRGLISKGELMHLSASLNFEEVYFNTDQLNGKGSTGKIIETFQTNKTYFPQVSISNFTANWNPKADSLLIKSKEDYDFYKGSTQLQGELLVRESGLYGLGLLKRQDSETKSNGIKFNQDGFIANKSDFIIKSVDLNSKPVLAGTKVDVNFDVKNSLVNISPQEMDFNDSLSSTITFPNAAYKTTIDNANWNIKEKKIRMKGELANSKFTATNSDQYNLSFNGTDALYEIDNNSLNISGISGINTVDSKVIPAEGKVSIKSGKIESLINATVISDTLNEYHTLANANITINSKLSYSGDAFYQFVNVSQDTFKIKMASFEFAEISPEGQILASKKSGKLSTIARAKVVEKDSVFLSPKILYRGDFTMLAPFKNLNLNGSVKPILSQYPVLGSNWINYSGSKSEAISINVDESLKDGGKQLYAGIHLKRGSVSEGLYPTFLSAKRSEDDFDIFLAHGVFRRDETNKRFVIDEQEKKNELSELLELYDGKGLIKVDGKLELINPELNKYVETYGQGSMELDSLKSQFSVLMKFNMPVPQPILLKIGDNMVKTNLDVGNSESALPVDSPDFMNRIAHIVGNKEAEDYRKQYYKGHIPLFKLSPKFFASILFSDLNLRWNPVFNSFYSTGLLGISNIGETDINAKVPGYVEIIRNPRKGDEIYMFFELSPNDWYYLGYKNDQLGIITSDYEINKLLIAKDKGSGAKDLDIIAVDSPEAMSFRRRFLQSYLGVSDDAFNKPTSPSAANKVEPVEIPVSKNVESSKTSEPTSTPTLPAKKKPAEEEDGF